MRADTMASYNVQPTHTTQRKASAPQLDGPQWKPLGPLDSATRRRRQAQVAAAGTVSSRNNEYARYGPVYERAWVEWPLIQSFALLARLATRCARPVVIYAVFDD